MTPSTWAAISNIFSPTSHLQTDKLDQWFVERENNILGRLTQLLSPERLPRSYLLVGPPGCGKSSTLAMLAMTLRRQRYDALVVHFDMTDHGDVERTSPRDILLLLAITAIRTAALELPGYRLPEIQLLADIIPALHANRAARTLPNTIFERLTSSLLRNMLLPLSLPMGTDQQLKSEVSIDAILDGLHIIVDDIRAKSKNRPVIFLIDGLDKLRTVEAMSRYFIETKCLAQLPCSVLYTAPLDLFYRPELGVVRSLFSVTVLPHVRLHYRDNPHHRDEPGYDVFRSLVNRRLASLNLLRTEKIIHSSALDMLITNSGGSMRDFLHLVQTAVFHGEIAEKDILTAQETSQACRDLRHQLRAQVTPYDQAVLDSIHHTHQRIADPAFDEMLRNGLLLPYMDGQTGLWFDTHPLLWR